MGELIKFTSKANFFQYIEQCGADNFIIRIVKAKYF